MNRDEIRQSTVLNFGRLSLLVAFFIVAFVLTAISPKNIAIYIVPAGLISGLVLIFTALGNFNYIFNYRMPDLEIPADIGIRERFLFKFVVAELVDD
ncbi:hypothetical protein [Devosia neptuniae]|uniref:hypothetical protein n=1 Tax=Devosia TaxID=46913 RepID=UPI0022B02C9B|nr:hypothetical protein [Devosia neptuniae]MCZ4347323.1 hypothetical protein [Devosia neptuniae]